MYEPLYSDCYGLFDKKHCQRCLYYKRCYCKLKIELNIIPGYGMHYVGESYIEVKAAMLNQNFRGGKILGVQDWTS